jgi:hypothetical protein
LATVKENPTEGALMPDVKMWRDEEILIKDTNAFLDVLRGTTASAMSCWIFKDGDPNPEYYKLERGEIDITVFDVITGKSDSLVIIEIKAYAFEGRMVNIAERLKTIARGLAEYMGISPSRVSITFDKVEEGCWVSG